MTSSLIRFIAFSDVHVPRYLPLVVSSVNSLVGFRPDIVFLAGDIVDRGDVGSFESVRIFLRSKFGDVVIVSVFGNEEYLDRQDVFRNRYRDVVWLDDSSLEISVNSVRLCVYGSRGSLERLTQWQSRNAPYLRELYEKRISMARENLSRLRGVCDVLVFLLHYAPTFLTTRGEPEAVQKFLGHRGYEKVILETGPDLVIHGHSHGSREPLARLGRSYILNVAVPAVGSVVAGVLRREASVSLEIVSPTLVREKRPWPQGPS